VNPNEFPAEDPNGISYEVVKSFVLATTIMKEIEDESGFVTYSEIDSCIEESLRLIGRVYYAYPEDINRGGRKAYTGHLCDKLTFALEAIVRLARVRPNRARMILANLKDFIEEIQGRLYMIQGNETDERDERAAIALAIRSN